VTWTAFLFIYRCSYLIGSTACYGDCLTFYMLMFVPHRSTACYGDCLTFYMWMFVPHRSTACYGDCLTFYMLMFVPHRKHGLLRGLPYFLYVDVRTSQEARPVTGTALLFYFLYVDVRTSQEARPVTGTALLFIYRCSYLTGSTACYWNCLTSSLFQRLHSICHATPLSAAAIRYSEL
jgi:hypothetical protein